MADSSKKEKLKAIGRSASTESTEYSLTMGKSVRRKKQKPKERWLLTRKTWRYMADAGRKLIPDGAQNRPEDIPKIEAYFQEVCKKEPRFLLWRKNSYPGALGFRKKRKIRPGGSCRKASSSDEIELYKAERPKDLAILPVAPGKFDVRKMKEDFLNKPPTPTDYSKLDPKKLGSLSSLHKTENQEESQLINMLEQYLTISKETTTNPNKYSREFNYQELVEKLQRHLSSISEITSSPSSQRYVPRGHVHFQGDHVQKSLTETLSRYFGQSSNRNKVISDILTDRKALEKLYFDLRKTKGFRGSRGGTGYTTTFAYGTQKGNYPAAKELEPRKPEPVHPPPLIEIEQESVEITYHDWGTQTLPIPEAVLKQCEEEYKKIQAEKEEEEGYAKDKFHRRRSSVDNDDVSQSVSDTIKRYLRMARKKSVDSDKADRFKRVNYDRNLRNIKAKGEITKPGDDDGLNKGCQTNDEWIVTYRDLKFDEVLEVSDVESRISSARSSIDIGFDSLPSSPPPTKSHSFLSHLLHGKHDKHDKQDKSSGVPAGAMQKSKSSSSVISPTGKLTKKIFRTRSKSQTRPAPCSWTPQGGCVWNSVTGKQVVLGETTLLQLTEIERTILQKVALAKLQALNLGVAIKVPSDNVGAASIKPKRRPYLLKRKALTTGIFDTSRKDGDKEASGGLVFGIPLSQCVENDRVSRAASGNCPFRSRGELVGSEEARIRRHGSRASFSSLIEGSKADEKGSCESLMNRDRIVGSVPGLLDRISCGSTADISGTAGEEEQLVPNILNECFRHLEQNGLNTLGIFRVSTSKKRVRELREDFDCGKETTLDNDQCPHDVATLLKEYLRDLPDPLLCRSLYHAFIQTQKIRNRRLQCEAIQHLIQLLPPSNRDTLYALLAFLANVAKHSNDSKDALGEIVAGNKMDSNNLATVFAPNILHCIKPGSKDSADKPEDRIDIINVVRTLIDHYKQIFVVSAELLDEVYIHMMDTHPEALDSLLNKKEALVAAEESVDELDSESYSAPWTPTLPTNEMSIESVLERENKEPKKVYSREEFLHESAATGGPNVGMRIRHRDRIRERSTRRKREESLSKKNEGVNSISIISKLKGQKDDDYSYGKHRSSSIESSSSTHTDEIRRRPEELYERRKSSPYLYNNSGVITASLTIPVQNPVSYNVDDDIPYIEEDSGRQQLTIGVVKSPTVPPRRRQHSVSGSDSSVASNFQTISGPAGIVHGGYDSAVGSSITYSSPHQNTPTSINSSITDAGLLSSPSSWASTPPTSPDSTHTSVNYIPDDVQKSSKLQKSPTSKEMPKVSFSTQDQKSTKSKLTQMHEPKFTPSISNIGNAVLRSKTADFERIIKVDTKKTTCETASDREKKKYTKRRYTDSRHQTRHIPDSEELKTVAVKKEESTPQPGPVYKRRELISSVPTK